MRTIRKYAKKSLAKKTRRSKKGGGPFDFLYGPAPADKKEEPKEDTSKEKTKEEPSKEETPLEEVDIQPDEETPLEEVDIQPDEDESPEEEDESPKKTTEKSTEDDIENKEESTEKSAEDDTEKKEEATEKSAEEVTEKPSEEVPESLEIFMTDKISTQPCSRSKFREIGIVHMSDSIALNLVRDTATNVLNIFGQKGFDNTIYDKLRNSCLEKMTNLLKENQRVCNLRIEIERDTSLIYMHLYGTLVEKN